jgi:hypothetical protein
MVLYAIFAGMAGLGLVDFDPSSGIVSFSVNSLEFAISGILGYIATFVASRFAKVK